MGPNYKMCTIKTEFGKRLTNCWNKYWLTKKNKLLVWKQTDSHNVLLCFGYLTIWKVYSKQLLVSCLLFYCLFVCVVGMCLLPNQTIDFVCSQISIFFNPFPHSVFIVDILYFGPLGTKRACCPLNLSLMDMILGPHKKNWTENLKSVQINTILRVSNFLTHPVAWTV